MPQLQAIDPRVFGPNWGAQVGQDIVQGTQQLGQGILDRPFRQAAIAQLGDTVAAAHAARMAEIAKSNQTLNLIDASTDAQREQLNAQKAQANLAKLQASGASQPEQVEAYNAWQLAQNKSQASQADLARTKNEADAADIAHFQQLTQQFKAQGVPDEVGLPAAHQAAFGFPLPGTTPPPSTAPISPPMGAPAQALQGGAPQINLGAPQPTAGQIPQLVPGTVPGGVMAPVPGMPQVAPASALIAPAASADTRTATPIPQLGAPSAPTGTPNTFNVNAYANSLIGIGITNPVMLSQLTQQMQLAQTPAGQMALRESFSKLGLTQAQTEEAVNKAKFYGGRAALANAQAQAGGRYGTQAQDLATLQKLGIPIQTVLDVDAKREDIADGIYTGNDMDYVDQDKMKAAIAGAKGTTPVSGDVRPMPGGGREMFNGRTWTQLRDLPATADETGMGGQSTGAAAGSPKSAVDQAAATLFGK